MMMTKKKVWGELEKRSNSYKSLGVEGTRKKVKFVQKSKMMFDDV